MKEIKNAFWGAYKFNGDPVKCAEEIMSLGEGFTASQLVEFAKNEGTELHKCFTWEDTEAARKWREHEARVIVGNLKITYMPKKATEPQAVRAFVMPSGSRQYKPIGVVVSRPDEYTALLQKAKAELAAFRKKYASLVELDSIFDAIDEII